MESSSPPFLQENGPPGHPTFSTLKEENGPPGHLLFCREEVFDHGIVWFGPRESPFAARDLYAISSALRESSMLRFFVSRDDFYAVLNLF